MRIAAEIKQVGPDEPIWGGRNIAATINKPVMATFHMLIGGKLPSAKKVNGQWLATRRGLYRDIFGTDGAVQA